jgi:hypothetical protein
MKNFVTVWLYSPLDCIHCLVIQFFCWTSRRGAMHFSLYGFFEALISNIWWMLFWKRIMRTKFDIYVFIFIKIIASNVEFPENIIIWHSTVILRLFMYHQKKTKLICSRITRESTLTTIWCNIYYEKKGEHYQQSNRTFTRHLK